MIGRLIYFQNVFLAHSQNWLSKVNVDLKIHIKNTKKLSSKPYLTLALKVIQSMVSNYSNIFQKVHFFFKLCFM